MAFPLSSRRAGSVVRLALIGALLGAADASAQEPIARAVERVERPESRPRFAEGEVLVRFRSGSIGETERDHSLVPLRVNRPLGIHRYRLADDASVADAVRALRSDARVEWAEPNWIYDLDAQPSDPYYSGYSGAARDLQRWVFDGIGADRNVNAEAAWDLTTGRSDVVIAIIDTGIDLDHPDLAANLWTNSGEVAGNGADDDANGYVDDTKGWDFRGDDKDPNPDLGDGVDNDSSGSADGNVFHGTFAASCAGAVTGNGAGLAGAAWGCRLMALKVFTDDGGAFASDIADALTYAADNGADVANMSLGGGGSFTMQQAVAYAHAQGVVLVASAGNGNSATAQYPASYAHVIAVGATDSGSSYGGGSGDIDGRASFSQFGPSAVDVVAPGAQLVGAGVRSVADGNPGAAAYYLGSGTSFSGPLVAGLAGLVISRARDLGATLTNDDVESIIQTTAVDLPDDPGDSPNAGATWDSHGRVDFLAAVSAVSGPPGNSPPHADAGPDRSGLAGESIAFDGSGSSDPDGDSLAYAWDFGDGSGGATGAAVTHAFPSAGAFVVTLTVSDGALTHSDTAHVSVAPSGGSLLLFAFAGSTDLPGLGTVENEDIVAYDVPSGTWSVRFDGSDVGLAGAALDGFCFMPDGDVWITFTGPFTVPGLIGGPGGSLTVDDSDIVRFTPSSLGSVTAGVFTFAFDGSDVGLTLSSEDVDAIAVDAGGRLLLSIGGSGSATGAASIQDEDLIRFDATSLGAATAGSFSMWFDGSDVGLGSADSEDLDAAFVAPDGRLYVSTHGAFSVPGSVSGGARDVLRFTPTRLGSTTAGSYDAFRTGSSIGIPVGANVTGFAIVE